MNSNEAFKILMSYNKISQAAHKLIVEEKALKKMSKCVRRGDIRTYLNLLFEYFAIFQDMSMVYVGKHTVHLHHIEDSFRTRTEFSVDDEHFYAERNWEGKFHCKRGKLENIAETKATIGIPTKLEYSSVQRFLLPKISEITNVHYNHVEDALDDIVQLGEDQKFQKIFEQCGYLFIQTPWTSEDIYSELKVKCFMKSPDGASLFISPSLRKNAHNSYDMYQLHITTSFAQRVVPIEDGENTFC